jgi:hypothetical protein
MTASSSPMTAPRMVSIMAFESFTSHIVPGLRRLLWSERETGVEPATSTLAKRLTNPGQNPTAPDKELTGYPVASWFVRIVQGVGFGLFSDFT